MSNSSAPKNNLGNFFEDFRIGQEIRHATPRTVSLGDVALYHSLFGPRFTVQSSDVFAQGIGYPRSPLDDLLVFHIVFGKTVPDISLNAVANLGYAQGRFLRPVYPGDTLSVRSAVIGLKQTSSGTSGVVYVRTRAHDQSGEDLLDYVRWVMVPKRDPGAPAPQTILPALGPALPLAELALPAGLDFSNFDPAVTGSGALWDDYAVGERIDHQDGVTIEEAEHAMATRLYHNSARIHFDRRLAEASRFGRRLIYGGHVLSLARALSLNGLANALLILAINGGRHVAPTFAGDTLYAWSEVKDKAPAAGRSDVGFLRLRTVAAKDQPCADFPRLGADGTDHPAVVLDFDYTVVMPRRLR